MGSSKESPIREKGGSENDLCNSNIFNNKYYLFDCLAATAEDYYWTR